MSIALKALSQWLTPTGFVQPTTPDLKKRYAKLREAIERELTATDSRALAVRCAHADLLGAIAGLEAAFPELNLSTEA